MPSLGWTEARRICDPCVPAVAAQLDRVTTAPVSQLQSDRSSVQVVLSRRSKSTTPRNATSPRERNLTGPRSPRAVPADEKDSIKVPPLVLPGAAASTKPASASVMAILSPRFTGTRSLPLTVGC